MEELGGHYAQWNKPDKEKHHMVSLICETFKKINKQTTFKIQTHGNRVKE